MYFWIGVLFLFILIPFCYAGSSIAPWVPTRKKDITRLLEILELQPWQVFLEIGCWDGRISRAVARAFPNNKVVGIELAFPLYYYTKIVSYFSDTPNMHLEMGNAFSKNFGKYDVIYIYGMPDKMQKKIVPKFLSEASLWAKLYSYVFSIPEEYKKDVISYGKTSEAKIHVLEKK